MKLCILNIKDLGKKGQNLWCDVITLLTIEEVFNSIRNLQKRDVTKVSQDCDNIENRQTGGFKEW